MRKGIIYFLLLACSIQLEATTRVKFYPELSVYSEINDYEYYRFNSYFIQTAYLFNKMYGLEFPEYKLEVVIEDKVLSNIIKNGKTLTDIVVITNQKLLFADIRNFERALIKAFLLAGNSISVDKCKDSGIEWIISGSLREINRQRTPFLTYPDFPIVNRVVQNQGKINYQKIITFGNIANDGVLYDCFVEESQILIDAILKKKSGKEFIFEYIKTLQFSYKYDKGKLFEELLKKYHTDFDLPEGDVSDSFNEFFNKTATELAVNPRIPLSLDKTADEFSGTIKFKDSAKNKEIHIDLLAGYLKDRKDRDFIIQKEKIRISRFANSINIFLAEPIQNMIVILDKLESDKDFSEEDYKDAMDVQIKSFYDAVSRLKLIEKYLCEVERKKSNIGWKYYLYLQEVERQNEPLGRAWPELQRFLNENYPIYIN